MKSKRWMVVMVAVMGGGAAVLLGCSSSSGGGSDVAADSGTKPVAEAGTPATDSGGGTVDNPPLPDPAICATNAMCQPCCASAFGGGAQAYGIALSGCVCSGTGSCASVCSPNECNALHSGARACDDCLNGLVTGACAKQANTECSSDTTCKAYLACLSHCK